MRHFVLALSCAFLAACVQTNATRLGAGPARPPVPSHQVAIYRSADKVPGKYEEVALLNSAGESSWTNEEKMFESMRKKAGQMGANGVILDAVSEPSAGVKVAAAVLGAPTQRKGRAIAIYVFPADSATPAAAAPAPADSTGR